MKKVITLLLICLMLVSLMACASQPEPSEEPSQASTQSGTVPQQEDGEKTLRVVVGREIKALDGEYGSNVGFSPYLHIFDALVTMTSEMTLKPGLALTWEQVEDCGWKFTLRQGVKFHDGSDFTAADVAYTFNRIATEDPKFNYAGNWGDSWPVTTEIVDDYTIIIRYQTLQPLFELLLPRIGILPENALENNSNFFIDGLIGTGAYKFVSWDVGNTGRITLSANADWWDGCPDIDNLIYEAIPDASARTLAFKNGEFDYIYEVPYDQVDSLSSIEGITVTNYETVNLNYVIMNPTPTADNQFILDPLLRQAMIYAVDHEPLANALWNGYSHAITGLGAPFTKGYRETGALPERDVAKAKELIAQSSYNGETLRIFVRSNDFYNDVALAEAVKTQLEEVGLNCTLEEVDSGAWKAMRLAGEYEITFNNGGTTIGDASFYYTQNRTTFGYKVPACEQLLQDMKDPSLSTEEYTNLVGDLLETFMETNPFMWVSTCPYLYGNVEGLEGVEFIPWGYASFHHATLN